MMPFNPRELKKLMKRAGIQAEEYEDVERVEIVRKNNERIVVDSPYVIAFRAGGQYVFQVIGEVRKEQAPAAPAAPAEQEVKVSEDDIKFVMEQTGASYEKAREALIRSKGDIIQAILELKGET